MTLRWFLAMTALIAFCFSALWAWSLWEEYLHKEQPDKVCIIVTGEYPTIHQYYEGDNDRFDLAVREGRE